jgi:hypothetical protein
MHLASHGSNTATIPESAANAKGRVVGILSLDDVLIELADQMGKIQALLQLERDQSNVDDNLAR